MAAEDVYQSSEKVAICSMEEEHVLVHHTGIFSSTRVHVLLKKIIFHMYKQAYNVIILFSSTVLFYSVYMMH